MNDIIRLENGGSIVPTDETVIECHDHGVKAKWGDLSPIQQLAVIEGIDVDHECILLPKKDKQ